MVALFIWLDVFKLMTFTETMVLLMLGGLAALVAYPISGRMLDTLPIGFSTYSRFVAPWIEEALKGLVIVALFAVNRIGFKLDAVISGFAVGAGFSVVENIVYLTRFPELGMNVWLVRGLGTAVMHGTTLAILAAIAHELAERETRGAAGDYGFNPLWFLPGFLAAVAIHTLFNQFPDRPLLAMMGTILLAPFALLAILHLGAREAQHWLESEREVHRAMLETLRAGGFPQDAAGRRIAALAARLGPDASRQMRDYWELQAWLVLKAEEILGGQPQDAEPCTAADIASQFERLAALKRKLGPTMLATLLPLLPFSRNDYWEIAQLKERLEAGRI
ncbi:MAG: PrsW family intramembrane metalloprotease [Sphingomonas sp.]|nr:PrsW family intramembrane metalloprotease [Sphingomonas sp.]